MPAILWLASVIALAAGLRFYQLGEESLWIDEAFSWQRAHWTHDQIWGPAARSEPNPPLYYSIQRVWLVFGDSEAALRSFSAVAGILTTAVVFLIGRLLAGAGAGLIAALFLATSASHVAYSQEARSYAFLMLVATAAAWGLLVFLRSHGGLCAAPGAAHRNRSRLLGLAAYATGTTLALYSHNTAVFLPLLANGVALCWWLGRARLDRRFAIEWLTANLVPLGIWLWWLPILFEQAQSALPASWIDQPSLPAAIIDAARIYGNRYLTFGAPWSQVLSLVPFLGLLAVWHWRDRWPAVTILLGFVLGVPLITWMFGFAVRPIWIERVVLWPLGLGFVLAAGGVLAVRPQAARMAVIGVVVAAQCANLAAYYRQVLKPPWEQIVAEVAAAIEERDALLYFPRHVARPFAYYARQFNIAPRDFGLSREWTPLKINAELASLDRSITDASLESLPEVAAKFARAWVIMRARPKTDPEGVVLARLEGLGTVIEHRSYGWVEVFLVSFERRRSFSLKPPGTRTINAAHE